MSALVRKIIGSPEPVRRRFFILFFVFTLPVVIGIWAFSMKLSLERHVPQETQGSPQFKKIVKDLTESIANARGMLSDLNLSAPFELGSGTFEPRPEPSRPRTQFPFE